MVAGGDAFHSGHSHSAGGRRISQIFGQKKGPFEGSERPKSREETPKEGSGMLEGHAALQQYVIALHKKQGSSRVPATFTKH